MKDQERLDKIDEHRAEADALTAGFDSVKDMEKPKSGPKSE